jgi:hypothetical protein
VFIRRTCQLTIAAPCLTSLVFQDTGFAESLFFSKESQSSWC